jgi:hypothetical protein
MRFSTTMSALGTELSGIGGLLARTVQNER